MDLDPEVKHAVLRVRNIINNFAMSKGWPIEDYRIFMQFNVVWGNIVVSLVAKAFDSPWFKENEIYNELLDYLELELTDDIGLYESVSLLIYEFQDSVLSNIEKTGENYINIDERLLNPDVMNIRPLFPLTSRKTD